MTNKAMVLCGVIAATAACSSAGGSDNSGGGPSYEADAGASRSGMGGALGIPAGGLSTGGSMTIATTTLPPEQETQINYLAPRAGDHRVYVANPTRNTVTIIDATTLAITEQVTGDTPTVVATVPGKDVALVINAGSHTLRVVRDATPGAASYPIVAKANAISIAPDGLHAVVWCDSSQTEATTTTSSTTTAGSTQEVSVVDLGADSTADSVASVSVGYNPSTVVFSSDSSAAFVVTDDGISELRFANITGPAIAPFTRIDNGSLTFVGSDAGAPASDGGTDSKSAPHAPQALDGGATPLDGDVSSGDSGVSSFDDGGKPDDASGPEVGASDAGVLVPDAAPARDASSLASATTSKAVDVSVTKAGDFAIARRAGTAAVLLIDLKARTVSTVLLSSEVTDLDLVDAPSGPQAFAVLRAESKLVRIDIPAGFTDESHRKPWPFAGGTIGSVTISANGTYALLYTTAVASKDLAVFNLATEQLMPPPEIHKTIRAVAIAPDEKTALVLHTRTTPSSTSTNLSAQDIVDQSYGYTMVNLADGFTLLHTTPADPNPFAITPDSSNAFVLLRDDKASIRTAVRISLANFQTTDFPLASPPNSLAALSPETHKVFVGQDYSEGRISFIDWMSATGDVKSVTGFALSGRIQQ